MIWPFPGNTKITTPWSDPRPLSNPGQHPHGAIDVKTAIGSKIIAPERGKLFGYFARREADGVYWPLGEMIDMPYRNYFYDMFGGILVLKGSSGMTHVFAHIYGNQLFNKLDFNWKDCYMEQKAADRFPIFCWKSKMKEVSSGEHIGFTGDSGHSSGPHCHYEVHQGFVWQDWAKRLDPERFVWEAFR